MSEHYDIVMIGSGASGDTLVHRLAPRGKRIFRFGTDPAASVLDIKWRAHGLENLYVVDTSLFPTVGAVNPAPTAIANGLRLGGHLLERPGASNGG